MFNPVDYPRLKRVLDGDHQRGAGRTFATAYLAAHAMIALPPGSVLIYPVHTPELRPYVAERAIFWLKKLEARINLTRGGRIELTSGTVLRIIWPNVTSPRDINTQVDLYCDTLGEMADYADTACWISYDKLRSVRPSKFGYTDLRTPADLLLEKLTLDIMARV